MARVGLDDMLRRIGAEDALHASFFVEINSTLAGAVKRTWKRWQEIGGGVMHEQVAEDVWDLLRNGAEPLRRVLARAP
eukprot:1468990-Lingulodinium_polyedra.AAC.1